MKFPGFKADFKVRGFEMTKEEMWKEFENQLVRETRTPMTMSYDASEKMIKSAIKETVAKWKERLEQQPCEDCVSRQAVIETIDDCNSDGLKGIFCSYDDGERFKEYVKMLPPVTPTHGTCKDCTNYVVGALDEEICLRGHELIHKDFYCRDFEKRGNENE